MNNSNEEKVFETRIDKLALIIFIVDIICLLLALFLIAFSNYHPVIALPALFFSIVIFKNIKYTVAVIKRD